MRNGTYKYFLNGKPTGIVETFSVRILPDGRKFTESVRDAKPFNTFFRVETTETNSAIQLCKILFRKDDTQIEAVYEFSENTLRFSRKIYEEIAEDETLELPESCLFFPLMRVFQGEIILKIAQNKSVTPVLVPDIKNPDDLENLLKPTFDERTAQKIGSETIAFYAPESTAFDADIYQYISKHYDENSQFWIDENGILVAYRFYQSANKVWEISSEFQL
jgi:hypothetical protein